MTRPHEDPACRCKACAEYDAGRGEDARSIKGTIVRCGPGKYEIVWETSKETSK